jgi:archaellum component FlaC
MGSQHRTAKSLMEQFVLSEEEAYEKARWIEAVSPDDEVSDALHQLMEDGDIDETLADLQRVAHNFSNSIMNLSAAFAGVKKRAGITKQEEM